MKTILKQAAILLTALILLWNCKKDGPAPILSPPAETLTVIDKITVEEIKTAKPDLYVKDQFVYNESGLLSKIYLHDYDRTYADQISGIIYEFHYGSNGKVSEYYLGRGFTVADLETSIMNNSSLDKITLSYDQEGRLLKEEYQIIGTGSGVVSELTGIGAPGKHITYFYLPDGNIEKVVPENCFNPPCPGHRFWEYDANGNPTSYSPDLTSVRTGKPVEKISYHDSLNPFHAILSPTGLRSLIGLQENRRGFFPFVGLVPKNIYKEVREISNDRVKLFNVEHSNKSVNNYPQRMENHRRNIFFGFSSSSQKFLTTTYQIEYKEIEIK